MRVVLLIISLACLVFGAACQKRSPSGLILISVDTLRSDHLGCYGYAPDTSPEIDRFSRDSILFRQAISHAPSTLLSHASLFTSLLPQQHGAMFSSRKPLSEDVLTLAEVLRYHGFRTAAFTSGGQLRPEFGFAQGFQVSDWHSSTLTEVWRRGLIWLESLSDDEQFFLFLHTYEVHHPYTPEPSLLELFDGDYAGDLPDHIEVDLLNELNDSGTALSAVDLAHIVATYDAGIRAMDHSFGEVVADLRSMDLFESSLIVLTSDHGEEFAEHGKVGLHSHTLYDELLRVPLVFKLPFSARAGRVVADQVRLIDLAPTVLDTLSIPAPDDFAGSSLLKYLDASTPRSLPAVSMKDVPRTRVESLRTARWKWYNGRLFDLRSDPMESENLAAGQPTVLEGLEDELKTIRALRPSHQTAPIRDSAEAKRQLRALGYLD